MRRFGKDWETPERVGLERLVERLPTTRSNKTRILFGLINSGVGSVEQFRELVKLNDEQLRRTLTDIPNLGRVCCEVLIAELRR